jgi:hypothetical protein
MNWKTLAEYLWGLRQRDHGLIPVGLGCGLPVENLKHPIRLVLDEKVTIQDVTF